MKIQNLLAKSFLILYTLSGTNLTAGSYSLNNWDGQSKEDAFGQFRARLENQALPQVPPPQPTQEDTTFNFPIEAVQDSVFLVGAASRTITPVDENGNLWMEPFEDLNHNGKYDPPNPNNPRAYSDPFTDTNGNRKWDGPWFAGFDPINRFQFGGRKTYYYATGVHDDLWARALVLHTNSSKVGFVALDIIGLKSDYVQKIQERAKDLGFTEVIVGSTHNHAGPDTLGIWGPKKIKIFNGLMAYFFGKPLDIKVTDGKDPRLMNYIVQRSVEALREADQTMRPAQAYFVNADPPEKYGSLLLDNRDPIVFDKQIVTMSFKDTEGNTIGTLVNWVPHPADLGTKITQFSSGFPHYIREALEKGNFTVDGKSYQGLGGTVVYFTGATGGCDPGDCIRDESGKLLPKKTYAKLQRESELAASAVLDSLEKASPVSITGLSVFTKRFMVPLTNRTFEEIIQNKLVDGALYVKENNLDQKYIQTETDLVVLESGNRPVAQMATIPGELFPEISVGGYLKDTKDCWIKIDDPNRPGKKRWLKIKAANPGVPTEPVIKDHMTADYKFILGLSQDYLGYIVPKNDFIPAPNIIKWGKDCCGNKNPLQHYHEALSVGPEMGPSVANAVIGLLSKYAAAKTPCTPSSTPFVPNPIAPAKVFGPEP
ncbi:MAG: hypothetical protein HY399_07380 [Elusimicrobia bacterium]|nr:hypothetical protein [Elusimicrobiota bacterium]